MERTGRSQQSTKLEQGEEMDSTYFQYLWLSDDRRAPLFSVAYYLLGNMIIAHQNGHPC